MAAKGAENEVKIIKLQIPAGKATPAPPVGPALGGSGINIMQFVKEFNDRTANQPGMIIPVVITVYKDKSFDYFGPYPNSGAAYQMIDLLNKIFPIRKCQTLPKETCLYYHLGQCLAPCINKIDESIFDELREEIKSFMRGNNDKQRRLCFSSEKNAC